MILSKTPLRISFAGGGSDYFNNKFKKNGKVIVTTINKYIYILFNKKHDSKIRLSYSETENVNNAESLQHILVKETLKFFKKKNGFEIITSADIPSSGSGLGSSSALIVGLVKAIAEFNQKKISKKKISEVASNIEINKCLKPIGFQDHYSTAFGGLNSIEFLKNKTITVKKLIIPESRINIFKNNLILFYTGINRRSDIILKEITNSKIHINSYDKLSSLADNFQYELTKGNLDNCGKILHENWMIKRELSKKISSSYMDNVYNTALKNGAIGGKLLGAGGGGYFLFYLKPYNKNKIIRALNKLNHIEFDFENLGTQSKVV
jgi:D-glycero-alpha-D-manno-heptose-7-phosphate kinase